MSEVDFTGKVAVVTGGASGIGLASARALVERGARVVLAGRNAQRGEQAAAALGKQAGRFVVADVTDVDAVIALFRSVAEREGRLDFVLNNAGVGGSVAAIESYPDEAWKQVLEVNLGGVFACMKYALPLLRQSGSGAIVNIASFVGTRVPVPINAIYGATKAAVVSLTAAAAAGCPPEELRFHALCPWVTDTAMMDRLTGGDCAAKAQYASFNPSGQLVAPEDIAAVALCMFADEQDFANGAAYLVDAGGKYSAL